jgi:hypothetical protein
MKYIPGSQFKNTGPTYGKYFSRGQVYTLKNISLRGGKLTYVFRCNNIDKEIVFETPAQADEFLSNFQPS